jgi:hypothetical protein
MKLVYFTFLLSIFISPFELIGQTPNYINLDTSNCKFHSRKVNRRIEKDFKALKCAEKYIISIVGKSVAKNIWFDCSLSAKVIIPLYSSNPQEYRGLGVDTIYELYYYVLDKKRVIGHFELSIDSSGGLIRSDYGCPIGTRPALIRGFKKHFEGNLKFSLDMAIKLGRQKGFELEPTLECQLESIFSSSKQTKEYVGIQYYWRFFEVKNGGDTGILEIDAQNGKIIKEDYSPRMPQ